MNLIILGNGYDMSLGIESSFENFVKDHKLFIDEFIENNANVKITIKKEDPLINIREEVIELSEVFKKCENWNDMEILLGSPAVQNYGYDEFSEIHGIQGLNNFLKEFSKKFKIWINEKEKNIAIPREIKYIENISYEDDIVISLNYTNTVPIGYNNVYKLHLYENKTEDDYCIIATKKIKTENNYITSLVQSILKKESDFKIDNVVLYGVSLHTFDIVDEHVVELVNELGTSYSKYIYINKNINHMDILRLEKRFDTENIEIIEVE